MATDTRSFDKIFSRLSGSLGRTFQDTADAGEADGRITELSGARGTPQGNDLLAEPDIARAVDADGSGELAVPQVEKYHRAAAEDSALDDFVARLRDACDLQVQIELIAPEPRHLGVGLGRPEDVARHLDADTKAGRKVELLLVNRDGAAAVSATIGLACQATPRPARAIIARSFAPSPTASTSS